MILSVQEAVLYAVLGLILLFIIFFLFFGLMVMIQYKKVFGKRIDKPKYLKYFDVTDYPGLKKEEISFLSTHKNKLFGGIYSYPREHYVGLVILSHGMGGGHLAYATEIEHFAKLGFLVLSYDNTGTAKSEGKKVYGLTQAVLDLNACLEFVKKDPKLSQYDLLLYGHSMGGYAVSNIIPFKHDIKGIVSLAAPNSINDTLPKNGFVRLWIYLIQRFYFKKYTKLKTVESYKQAYMPVLVVHGTLDTDVPFSVFEKYQKEVQNEQVTFLSVPSKFHRPNVSDETVSYIIRTNHILDGLHIQYGKNLPDEVAKEYYESLDYDLLVKFDDKVMAIIDQFMFQCLK